MSRTNVTSGKTEIILLTLQDGNREYMRTVMLKRTSKSVMCVFCVAIFSAAQLMAQQSSRVQKVSAFYLAQGLDAATEPAQLSPPPQPNLGNVPTPKIDLDAQPTPAAGRDGFESASHPIFDNPEPAVPQAATPSLVEPEPQPAEQPPSFVEPTMVEPNVVEPMVAGPTIESPLTETTESPAYIIQSPDTLTMGPAATSDAAVVDTGAGCSSGGADFHAPGPPMAGAYYVVPPESSGGFAPVSAATCSGGGLLGTLKAKMSGCKLCGSQSNCGCALASRIKSGVGCGCNSPPVAAPSSCGCGSCQAAPQPAASCGCGTSCGLGSKTTGNIFSVFKKKTCGQNPCVCGQSPAAPTMAACSSCAAPPVPACSSCAAPPMPACSTCGPAPCDCGPPLPAPCGNGDCGFSFGKLKRGLFGSFAKAGSGIGAGRGIGRGPGSCNILGGCAGGSCGISDGGGCGDGSCGVQIGSYGGCDSCGDVGCGGGGGCGGCGSCDRKIYGSAHYLLWWSSGMNLPSLATTSSPGTPATQAGLLGAAPTSLAFGGNQEALLHSGGRYTMGINLDCEGCNRLEFNYLFLTDEGEDFESFGGNTGGILGRPFTNVFTGNQDAELVGFPGVVDGRLRIDTSTDFQSFGVLWRHNLTCCKPCGCGGGIGPSFSCQGACGTPCGYDNSVFRSRGIELLIGYRHLELADQVRIEENLTTTDPNGDIPAGTTFDIVDRFRTENKFDGVDLGLNWEGGKQRWGVGLLGKVAIGRTRTQSSIAGSTVIATPDGQVATNSGGLLALDSNIGVFDDEDFSVIPEFGAYLYYCLGTHGRFRFGYNMIYWSDVIRASGIIDTNVDPRLLPPVVSPNSGRPQFIANREDFWAQGLTFGVDFSF